MTSERDKMALPRVSVVMGVYNEAEHVGHTLDSVFAQDMEDLECIVIDDGSTDSTHDFLQRYAAQEPRLRIVTHEEHRGLTEALKRGVDEAQGVWMARIDSGDTWHPERLSQQLAFVEAHPEVGIVGSASEDTNQQTGKVTVRTKPEGHDAIITSLWRACPFIHPSILVRLDLVREAGNYDPAYVCSQDYDLYCRLLFMTRGHNLPEVLLYRPTHGAASISLRRWKDQARCTFRIRWRYLRQYKRPLKEYRHLAPPLAQLLLPAFAKGLKQRFARGAS